MYRKFNVKIKVRDKLLGGIPRTDTLIEGWLKSRNMEDITEETKAQLDIVEETNKAWTGFKMNESGAILEARNVKALIKECCTVMKFAKITPGLKQLLQHGVFVKPDFFELGEITGHVEMCAHVMGPRGPRSILKRHDYIQSPELEFEVWVLNTHKDQLKQLPTERLQAMFEHGQELGLGCSRSQGYGKFDVLEFTEL